MLKYFKIFKINAARFKLDQLDLRLKHIVHLFEILEGLVMDDLIQYTNPRYQGTLSNEQKI